MVQNLETKLSFKKCHEAHQISEPNVLKMYVVGAKNPPFFPKGQKWSKSAGQISSSRGGGGWMDGWMDGLSVAGGCSQGPRHVALAAQLPNQLHVQTQHVGNDSHRDPSRWPPSSGGGGGGEGAPGGIPPLYPSPLPLRWFSHCTGLCSPYTALCSLPQREFPLRLDRVSNISVARKTTEVTQTRVQTWPAHLKQIEEIGAIAEMQTGTVLFGRRKVGGRPGVCKVLQGCVGHAYR